jgi:hypothetical protein
MSEKPMQEQMGDELGDEPSVFPDFDGLEVTPLGGDGALLELGYLRVSSESVGLSSVTSVDIRAGKSPGGTILTCSGTCGACSTKGNYASCVGTCTDTCRYTCKNCRKS